MAGQGTGKAAADAAGFAPDLVVVFGAAFPDEGFSGDSCCGVLASEFPVMLPESRLLAAAAAAAAVAETVETPAACLLVKYCI
jgi:hypothetical protein